MFKVVWRSQEFKRAEEVSQASAEWAVTQAALSARPNLKGMHSEKATAHTAYSTSKYHGPHMEHHTMIITLSTIEKNHGLTQYSIGYYA